MEYFLDLVPYNYIYPADDTAMKYSWMIQKIICLVLTNLTIEGIIQFKPSAYGLWSSKQA